MNETREMPRHDDGLAALDRWEGAQKPRHPFSTSLWLGTWWECFGDGGPLPLSTVTDGDDPVALLPLHSEREHSYGVPLSRIGVPWNPHTPRIGLLVADSSERTCQAVWRHLRDAAGSWDVLRLCQVPDDDAAAARRISRLAENDGFLVGRWQSNDSPYVPIESSWDDYFASLTSKFRSNLRRRRRLLEELGPVDFETLDGNASREQLDRALDDAFRLESSGWKSEEGTAIENHPNRVSFYRLLAHRAAAAGWLRLRFLVVDGHRVAVNYSLLYGNRLFFLKGGYHPEISRCSPSHVLLEDVLRDAHQQGYDEVDLLGDDERWKRRWTPHHRSHEWLFVYRPSLRTRLVHSLKFDVAPRVRATFGDRESGGSLTTSPAASS